MPVAKLDFKRLNECSLTDAVNVWNEGFKGYFVDMTLTPKRYLERLHNEGLSQEYSLVAFIEGTPAGFLLSGIRTSGGMRVAWNGGTGVSPEFRKQGVGHALVQAALDLYSAEGVELATLEAISTNEPAIALYQKFGYELVDRLIFLLHEGRLEPFTRNRDSKPYRVRSVDPAAVSELDFYRCDAPWQTQWQSLILDNGEAVIAADANGVEVGYALFRKKFSDEGKLASVALHQCEADPHRPDSAEIVASILEHLYSPLDEECRRSTANLRMSNQLVLTILREAGFKTFVEQVHMRWNGEQVKGETG